MEKKTEKIPKYKKVKSGTTTKVTYIASDKRVFLSEREFERIILKIKNAVAGAFLHKLKQKWFPA